MIHSLSGGVVKEDRSGDFAKVEIEGEGFFWYLSDIFGLKEGDFVLVPFGKTNKLVRAKVIRIDKDISYKASPIPFKHAKKISSKI